MRIDATDVVATALIAAGIVTAHTVTDALFGSPEYQATIWVDSTHDPLPDVFRHVPIDPESPQLRVILIGHNSPRTHRHR